MPARVAVIGAGVIGAAVAAELSRLGAAVTVVEGGRLVGVRPIPADGLPVLGRSAAVENFHLAVAHSGATLCLRIAELLAPEVLGYSQSPELASFRHARPTPSAEAATASTPGAR
jgi:glycine/D-amino acid oxidase-like deaminating enzyme